MVQAESMVTMESFSLSVVAVGSAAAVVYLCVAAWVSWLHRVGDIFRRQGIDAPPPSSFLMGNLPEMQATSGAWQQHYYWSGQRESYAGVQNGSPDPHHAGEIQPPC
ncbi:hypothetical protein ZWY2020_007336 [Hordeum vulgare]|nr:hypothetical protein ZWY2020_007336 [Hordeum vulgare]